MKLKYKLLLLYVAASLFILLVIGSFLSSALKDITIDRIARNYREQLKHIDFGLSRLIRGMDQDLEAIAQNEFVRSREDRNFTSFLDADE
jgi:sensor histidine kinase YesM